jgi:hypothetical protein
MAVDQVEPYSLEEWIEQVERLYARLEGWIRQEFPAATIERRTVQVHERWSGPYEAPALLVTQGAGTMEIRPVARAEIGSDGRVDVMGYGRFMHFLRHGEEWNWIQDHEPWLEVPLDASLFKELAMSHFE